MRHWTDKYIGIPFVERGRDFNGCDCGGLVLLALKQELGVEALDFQEYEKAAFRRMEGYKMLGEGMRKVIKAEWLIVDKPKPFDLVRFWYGRHPSHVGLYAGYSNYFLHVEASAMFARLESLSSIAWGPRFFEFRRHRSQMEAV